jgi:hypothetical protein
VAAEIFSPTPVASPIFGVINVGEVCKTRFPVPVAAKSEALWQKKTCAVLDIVMRVLPATPAIIEKGVASLVRVGPVVE